MTHKNDKTDKTVELRAALDAANTTLQTTCDSLQAAFAMAPIITNPENPPNLAKHLSRKFPVFKFSLSFETGTQTIHATPIFKPFESSNDYYLDQHVKPDFLLPTHGTRGFLAKKDVIGRVVDHALAMLGAGLADLRCLREGADRGGREGR